MKKKNCTTIGGQAVIEGVMMRSNRSMATAVRDENGNILLETERFKRPNSKVGKIPIVRGVVSFFSSMITGVKILSRSAEVFGEGEPTKFEKWCAKTLKINVLSVVSFFSVFLGLALAIALFIFAPQGLRILVLGENPNVWARNFLEGGFKLIIFILYILLSSLIKDVRRTFMYHGAEHKTISCFESGLALTPENAKKCSRVHNRCGTTFIFFVMFISIIVFALFESLLGANGVTLNGFVRLLCKIALLPLVAGLSYELLKGLAKTDCWVFYPIKAPGLLLQRLTTREPDLDMIEVAISAFNQVMLMDSDESIAPQKFDIPFRAYKITAEVREKLLNAGIDESAEAEWIVSICSGLSRSEAKGNAVIDAKSLERIRKITDERITGRPLWYCIGDTEFYGFKIKVDERVLIPRPETELLVENALKSINGDSKVLDLCTGSGAIAIAINKKSGAKTTAVDISEDALTLAKENAEINGADVEFIKSDMFGALDGRKFDVIVSNPPYIKSDDIKTLQREVKDFEPLIALDGGVDGLDFYRIIAKNAPQYLKIGGTLLLECGVDEAEKIKGLLSAFSSVEIIKDYENIDRIVKAVL